MPLLREGQITSNDGWTVISDDADLDNNRNTTIVSLQRYLDLQDDAQGTPGGLIVAPEDDVLELKPYLSQLKLIGIDFPKYTDGRGYSHARLLRKRLGYQGELRAFGDIRPDQILFMTRSGITSFHFAKLPDTQLLQILNARYQKNYQPSYPLPSA